MTENAMNNYPKVNANPPEFQNENVREIMSI